MGEGVVYAGLVAVFEVMRAAVRDVVVGAGCHEFEVAVGCFAELGFVVGEEGVGGVTAVASAGAPVCPLVVAGAPTVVPCAVGEHELHVRAEGGDGFFEDCLVVGEEGVLGQRGERFFDVVAEVDGAAFFGVIAVWGWPSPKRRLLGVKYSSEAWANWRARSR